MQQLQQADQDKIWNLIKDERTALLVTVDEDGTLDARPMGALQRAFDGTLWFGWAYLRACLTGRSARMEEIAETHTIEPRRTDDTDRSRMVDPLARTRQR